MYSFSNKNIPFSSSDSFLNRSWMWCIQVLSWDPGHGDVWQVALAEVKGFGSRREFGFWLHKLCVSLVNSFDSFELQVVLYKTIIVIIIIMRTMILLYKIIWGLNEKLPMNLQKQGLSCGSHSINIIIIIIVPSLICCPRVVLICS